MGDKVYNRTFKQKVGKRWMDKERNVRLDEHEMGTQIRHEVKTMQKQQMCEKTVKTGRNNKNG
jgi:trans-2-enoyl-CoA reductase